jgi:hypothetical protein
MAPPNTTSLLDLDEMEQMEMINDRNNMNPTRKPEFPPYTDYRRNGTNVDKFIRPNMNQPLQESGMRPRQNQEFNQIPGVGNGNMQPQPLIIPNISMVEDKMVSLHEKLKGTPSCLEIADHISMCPICSRFYRNDSTIFVIAVVILVIICILLLKRVLNI